MRTPGRPSRQYARVLADAWLIPALLVWALAASGCWAPSARLTFPTAPISVSDTSRVYDVDHDGRPDFALLAGLGGRLDTLAYDDNQDGTFDRRYSLHEYTNEEVPHLIILFDSLPFAPVLERSREAGWTWFDPPQKVIPPFPTMSGVIFSRMVGAPPMQGMINQSYDPAAGASANRIFERTTGDLNPWERRLHYRLGYMQNGMAFLRPRPWFQAELAMAKAAFDHSPDRVTLVYFASTACMLSKYGAEGLREVLDGLEQLSLQILWERRGAVKISAMADHGHNLIAGARIDIHTMLRDAGFNPCDRLRSDRDAVVELDGLVNYAGIYTRHPAEAALALTRRPKIQLAMYMEDNRVIVRDAQGAAAVERRDGRYRYTVIDHDVLDYQPVSAALAVAGKTDADGFADPADWFAATSDHHWPDAPPRLWEAFHTMAHNTPSLMVTTTPGYFVGLASMAWFIDMASTHGGFDQTDSATFMLTMTGRGQHPMRTQDVIPTIEPSYNPRALRR